MAHHFTIELHISKVLEYIFSGKSYNDLMYLSLEIKSMKQITSNTYSIELTGDTDDCVEYLKFLELLDADASDADIQRFVPELLS
jgi:hypothetical protein